MKKVKKKCDDKYERITPNIEYEEDSDLPVHEEFTREKKKLLS
ncbi:MAG: hypothetical protein QXK37_04210 [Candidatus Woesearchaeota archaeon]